jgi:hypothetical protein
VLVDSLPLATCCPVPDRVMDPPQVPALPPVTPPQVTLIADLGTVAQFVKDAAAACTFKFQVLPAEPPDVVQLIVAAELPESDPRSGSVAVKLIVPGMAVTALIVVAIGKARLAGTTMRAFCCAESICMVPAASTTTDISLDPRFM